MDYTLKPFRIAITGNPGVGKHTVAFGLQQILNDLEVIDINDLVLRHQAFSQMSRMEIDTRRLKPIIKSKLDESCRTVVVGHLAPYVLMKQWINLAIVLRRSPYSILNILEKRNYTTEKVRENVASEILGITLYDSIKCFGKDKIAEYDTTQSTPTQVCKEIVSLLRGRSSRRVGVVDWLALISERDDVQRFLEYT